jgi:hypothetical protein
MSENDSFLVRDLRNKQHFIVDDAYLNGYAKLCGPNATLVYLCLCRHSDRHQESFPSVQLMAEKTGISRDSVMRGIKKLIEWNIISKERERREDAIWLNNRYVLLDKTVWKAKPSSTEPLGAKSQNEPEPSRKSDPSQVAHSDTKVSTYKDTHEKDTHLPDTNAFFELFGLINPSYQILYPRKPQRDASERLLKLHPFEWWKRFLAAYSQELENRFCPKATTPVQLEEKLAAIEAYARQKKSGNSSISFV